MRYDRLFTKLFRSPLLLEPNTRAGFEAALWAMMSGQIPEPPILGESPMDPTTSPGLPVRARNLPMRFDARKQAPATAQKRAAWLLDPGFGRDGKTAILHVDGVIDKHLSTFEASCFDATDLNDFDRALGQAAADPSVDNVLIYFNSPGGTVTGVPESGSKIAALAQQKNVFGFTDGLCCSAAYWMASQCDQMFCTASAQVGSIGVYLAVLDASRQLEAMGQKVETIKDGRLKAAGAYWKPLSDDERAHFQAQVNQIGEMFRGAVNAKRPSVSNDTMQGQSFMGKQAQECGLVDAVLPGIEAAIEEFEQTV